MPAKSLRSQLNQIRAWVRQGRTDAWIAHQLEVSASELRDFRRQHGLSPDDEAESSEVDLRDEIEAEIEAAAAEEPEADEEETESDEEPDGEAGARRGPWRRPSLTAMRATGSGSIRRSRTIPPMPSTGRGTARSRSRSSPSRS